MGAYLAEKLEGLAEEFPCITARRGMGLMQGLVLTVPVGEVVNRARDNGLLVITAGSDVLRLVPPLIIEKAHVDEMIEKLSRALRQVL